MTLFRTTLVFIVAVPNYLSTEEFIAFCGSHVEYFSDLCFIRGEEQQFTHENILDCMKKGMKTFKLNCHNSAIKLTFFYSVTAVDLKQNVQVDKDLQIRPYYAGHVLGAAMFYACVEDSGVVCTGDYNMTPDRHLGAAQIDRLQLDLLITESTYATTIRYSKYAREREFLKAELCILLDDYWELMNLKVPIYFSAGLTIQANLYYKVLINWTSQKVKDTYATRNAFDFKNVHSFDRSLLD
ncbi:hypothetical protein LXL04_038635 [Taraxacum kok-saghyz]